jgi:septum formation protein
VTALVLASASPARLSTLRRAGVQPVVRVSGIDEDAVVARYGVTDPCDVALLLARVKAEDVARSPALPADAVVLGCDSVLELDGTVHGKPPDAADAVEGWRRMRGRSGVLRTGHWLVDARSDPYRGTGATVGAVASTTVHFAMLSDDEIEAYVATGEPLRVAGAFTVDGLGGAFVRGVEGDHHNVVGLSLPLLRDLLGELGVAWHTLWQPGVASGTSVAMAADQADATPPGGAPRPSGSDCGTAAP